MKTLIIAITIPFIVCGLYFSAKTCDNLQSNNITTQQNKQFSLHIKFGKDTKWEGRNYLLNKIGAIRYQKESLTTVAYVYDEVGQVQTKITAPLSIIIDGKEVIPNE